MYKRYKSGHQSNRTAPDGNPEPDQSARRAQSVTEAVISRGLSNLSVVRQVLLFIHYMYTDTLNSFCLCLYPVFVCYV